ncbi:MAG: hypothetical protein ACYDGM_13025 [Vulcanimicrobiaceae bacterium]
MARTTPAYTSRIRIERLGGPVKRVFLPAEEDGVIMGVHGAIAKHYNVSPDAYPPRASTIDYVIGATAA